MSIAGGIQNAFAEAKRVGCDCMQIFVKNQRQWYGKQLTDDDVRSWNQAASRTAVFPVVAHDTYLINLASPDEAMQSKSLDAFVHELERCEALALKFLVTHPGSPRDSGEREGIGRMVKSLDEALGRTRGMRTRVLLETTAGQGSTLGWRFEHLAEMRGGLREPERVGFCFDTCHVFAAGYDISTRPGYDSVMEEFDRVVGTRLIEAFHLNDSKKGAGSRVDRHEHIGRGAIGDEAFRCLLNDARFAGTPKVLETPKEGDMDAVNLKHLRSLAGGKRGARGGRKGGAR